MLSRPTNCRLHYADHPTTRPTETAMSLSLTDKLRNVSRGAYFDSIPWWDSGKVQSARFLVIGAGALGNEVVKNLALLDARRVTIIDFDDIERSNLTRSIFFRESDIGRPKVEVVAERALEVNPDMDITTLTGDMVYELGLGHFRHADAIICCVDNRLARLYINRYSFLFDKPWINGAIENLMGRLEVYQRDKHCYESNLSDQEWQHIRFRMGCADVAKRSEAVGSIPTTPIAASVIGAWQVQEALKVVHGYDKHLSAEESIFVEGMSNTLMSLRNPAPVETISSSLAATVLTVDIDQQSTLAEALAAIEAPLGPATILLRHEIIHEAVGKTSDVKLAGPIVSYRLLASYSQLPEVDKDEELYITNQTNRLDSHSPYKSYSLAALGVPDWDVLQVMANGEMHYVQINPTKE